MFRNSTAYIFLSDWGLNTYDILFDIFHAKIRCFYPRPAAFHIMMIWQPSWIDPYNHQRVCELCWIRFWRSVKFNCKLAHLSKGISYHAHSRTIHSIYKGACIIQAVFGYFGGHFEFYAKTVSVTLLKVAYFNYWAKITYNLPYCMPRSDDFITNQQRPVYYLYGSHLGLSHMATKGCVNLGESGFGILFCYFKLAKLSKYISYNAQQPYTPVHYIPVFKPFSVILVAILDFKQQPSMWHFWKWYNWIPRPKLHIVWCISCQY